MAYSILDRIETPSDLKLMKLEELPALAKELRSKTIEIVSKCGGHLGASLGVVELTLAIHYVFNTPEDKVIFDVGHQCYPHKILTGRKNKMSTLRQCGGIAGFPKRSESQYDAFGTGHSSTSISAAMGFAVARDLDHKNHHVIAIIGDGAMSAGLAYEGLNNVGALKKKMIIILNDNEMSISKPVGAISSHLCRLMSSAPYLKVRSFAKGILRSMPNALSNLIKKMKRNIKDFAAGGNFFEEMGFHYIGPVDGHEIINLTHILQNIRDAEGIDSPILLHVKTIKGYGFNSPEGSREGYHQIGKFDLESKKQTTAKTANLTYTKVFSNTLARLMEKDDKIIAITAAMPSSTGLDVLAQAHPNRVFDVGIAEQHAVTFAAGLAAESMKPFVAIYSTFLQRSFDQIIHDVAVQKLPVRFAIDRAGIIGADGPTHAGSFDIAYLSMIPNMVIMAPSDGAELASAVVTAYSINDRPSAFRYPRGEITDIKLNKTAKPFAIGKAKMVQQGEKIAILTLGSILKEVLIAQKEVKLKMTIIDARFAKPIDTQLIEKIAKTHQSIIIVEEGSMGGFASTVSDFLETKGLLDKGLVVRSIKLPDVFLDHADPKEQRHEAGLDSKGIVQVIKEVLKVL